MSDAPKPVSDAIGVGGRAVTRAAPATRTGEKATGATEPVGWTLPLLCFLLFIFVSTTYAVPLATAAATGALLSLPLLLRQLRFPVALVLFGAFVAWAGVGYITTGYPADAWPRWLDLAKAWLIMLVAVNAMQTRRQVMAVTVFFLACFAMYPMRGAYFNYFIYRSTIRGRVSWNFIYANSNDLAAFALVPIALCMGICVSRQRRDWVWWGAAAGLLTLPLMIFLTQSRGAIIALSLLVLLALATYRRRLRALGLIAVAFGIVTMFAPSSVWDRLSGLRSTSSGSENLGAVDPEGSAEQRYEIWKVAARISQDYPVTGVGIGAYPRVHYLYAEQRDFKPTARGLRDPHSTYLSVLAETGVPGFLLFMGGLIAAFVHAEHVRRSVRATNRQAAQQLLYLEYGVLSFLVAGIFGSYGHLAFLYIYLALMYAMAESLRAPALAGRAGAAVTAARRVARPA